MKRRTNKIVALFLVVVVFVMTFSVGAFAGYENDYVKVEYPENYDVTEYSSSEDDIFGFYVDLYFNEWKKVDGKEFYTGNTVELTIEYYDIESPDEVYDESYLENLKHVVASESDIELLETYHETVDGYDVLFYDIYYVERFSGDDGERIAEDRFYSEAFVVQNECLVHIYMHVADAENFKQYRNETISKFLGSITYDVDDIEDYGTEETAFAIIVLLIVFGLPLIIVIIAVVAIIVLSKKRKKKQQQMQQQMMMGYYYPPQPIMPINQPVVTPPRPVVPDSQEMDKTTDIKEENNNENR